MSNKIVSYFSFFLLLNFILFCSGGQVKNENRARPQFVMSSDFKTGLYIPASWNRLTLNEDASIQVGNEYSEAYLLVISESKLHFEDNFTFNDYFDLITNGIIETTSAKMRKPQSVLIAGKKALQTTLEGHIENLNITYLVTVTEDENNFHQIVSWSLSNVFEKNKENILFAVNSFKTYGKPQSLNPAMNFMKITGIIHSFESFQDLISSTTEKQKKLYPEHIIKKITKAMHEAFDSKSLIDNAAYLIAVKATKKELEKLTNKFKNPLLKKVVDLENKAHSPEEHEKSAQFMVNTDFSDPQIQKRYELAKRFDHAINGTKYAVALGQTIVEVSLKSLFASMPEDKTPHEDIIDRKILEQKLYLANKIGDTIPKTFVYQYQELSDEEFLNYILFSESEDGQLYNDLSRSAIFHAIDLAAKDYGERLARIDFQSQN